MRRRPLPDAGITRRRRVLLPLFLLVMLGLNCSEETLRDVPFDELSFAQRKGAAFFSCDSS